MSFENLRKVRLVNLFSFLAAGSSLPYAFVFEQPFLRIVTIAFVGLCIISYFLNRARKYMAARYLLLMNSSVYLFITASAFGRASGEQLIYLPVIFGAVLVYEFSEFKNLLLSIGVILLSLAVLEFTDYKLFTVNLTPQEQLEYYYGNLIITFSLSVVIALFYFRLYARQNIRNEQKISSHEEIQKTLNHFIATLDDKNTLSEIARDVAGNCVSQLGFHNCIVYLLDEDARKLTQKAVFHNGKQKENQTDPAIEIPAGSIAATAASTGVAQVTGDTTQENNPNSSPSRISEMAMPIIYQNRVIGVVDAGHPERNFFTDTHLSILTSVAAFCSNKIVKTIAEEERIKATLERLEAEKIKELDKIKSKFFANISHEFRTPLTLIMGPLDEMIRTGNHNPEKLRQLKMMYSSSQKLLQLINDLLQLSRLDEGVLRLDITQEDIYHFLRMTAASFYAQAQQYKIRFESLIPASSLVISFDMLKIETIITNLLNHAFKFTAAGGHVSISARYTPRTLHVYIHCDSMNVPADHATKIFDWDYLVENAAESGAQEIGLVLAKELARMHDGNLEMIHEQDGSRFILSIPASPVIGYKERQPVLPVADEITEEDTHDADDTATNVKKPVVLLVEDNSDVRGYLRRILTDDFVLYEAADGEAGLQTALQHIPDLLISDVMMPRMDGFELCRQVKSREMTSHIPVLMLTAKADIDSKLEGLGTGADYYMPKPFDPRELLTVAHNLIEQRKKLQDHFTRKVLLQPREWEGSSADDRFLQKLMDLVQDHLSDTEYTVEDLQRDMGISRMQLHRKLKALTGQSATEFVRTIRLKRAAEMLLKEQDNVSQIAYQVGFSSLSYFTKCFKDQYGVIPSAYGVKNTAQKH